MKGSAVRIRASALENQSALAPQPRKNPARECDFTRAQEAHEAGAGRIAERYFAQAWKAFTPTARNIARRICRDESIVDDALQVASLKIWRSITNGYKPRDGWPQIASTATHHAAVQVLDRTVRYRCDDAPILDDPTLRDAAEYRSQELYGVVDADAAMSFEHFAKEAERRGGQHGKLWAAIIREVAAGNTDRETIAANLGRPAGTIRRHIWQMRRVEGLFESLTKREVIIAGEAAEAMGQLFAFDYTEC
jgi:DNA-directed RNA polymerase specialized sigma24 family protein